MNKAEVFDEKYLRYELYEYNWFFSIPPAQKKRKKAGRNRKYFKTKAQRHHSLDIWDQRSRLSLTGNAKVPNRSAIDCVKAACSTLPPCWAGLLTLISFDDMPCRLNPPDRDHALVNRRSLYADFSSYIVEDAMSFDALCRGGISHVSLFEFDSSKHHDGLFRTDYDAFSDGAFTRKLHWPGFDFVYKVIRKCSRLTA